MSEERRRHKRIIIGFDAEINYNGRNYTGVIENLSESGVCLLTNPTEDEVEFTRGTAITLTFSPYPGETLTLQCCIKWSYTIKPHGILNRIGMKIIEPPWEKSGFFI